MIDACVPRSKEALRLVLESFHVETAEKYRERDVTGDGHAETFCNLFLHDVTTALECPVPLLLANAQALWFKELGPAFGWKPISVIDAIKAIDEGRVIVSTWNNPRGHGHVAVGSPSEENGLHVAQAGATNFTCRPISRGFGLTPYQLWVHD